MKAGGGRIKGSTFERKIAKTIVAKFADANVTSKHCYRTPLSGGHVHASKTDPGDLVIKQRLHKLLITAFTRRAPLHVECKFYKSVDWLILLSTKEKKGTWHSWWTQTKRGGGIPLLVFRQNRTDAFIMYRQKDVVFPTPAPSMRVRVAGEILRVARFDEFLLCVRRAYDEFCSR